MLAIHDAFTHQMCDRLKTTVMGLGLARLLQDAGRTEEARTTLYSLEDGFQGIAEKSNRPHQKPSKGVTRTAFCSSETTRINAARRLPQSLSIA